MEAQLGKSWVCDESLLLLATWALEFLFSALNIY